MQGLYFGWNDSLDTWVSWPHSGQGGACRGLGPTKLAVFTVVNAVGAVVDRDGRVVRSGGWPPRCTAPWPRPYPDLRHPQEDGNVIYAVTTDEVEKSDVNPTPVPCPKPFTG